MLFTERNKIDITIKTDDAHVDAKLLLHSVKGNGSVTFLIWSIFTRNKIYTVRLGSFRLWGVRLGWIRLGGVRLG